MDVKPVGSFIHHPCEPVEASEKETYDVQPVTQFQIVQYETRREFWVLVVKSMFRSLHIVVEMRIMLVLYRRKPFTGILRFWPIMNAGLWQWVNIVRAMAKLIA